MQGIRFFNNQENLFIENQGQPSLMQHGGISNLVFSEDANLIGNKTDFVQGESVYLQDQLLALEQRA